MSTAIRVCGLSKAYQLGEIGTGTISRDLERLMARMRGKEDPFLKIGEVNDRTIAGKNGVIWGLRDLNFEIQQGDTVGIIGRNGAGKSTLLKILSRVTAPTSGLVKVKGRIASLLEVGTGFHPDLTGRENIFLNGAILGMRKSEIERKFDEIVAFSGVERYIDTPVKRYSSGMYVRLAFAVAAHLESEIMIVDEVLAVGDAEFQRKCLGKMGDISKGEGRTVLFVSHNMTAIQKLCRKSILLNNGHLEALGETTDIVPKYLQASVVRQSIYQIPLPEDFASMPCYACRLQVEDINGNLLKEIPIGSAWQVRVIFTVNKFLESFIIALSITNSGDQVLRTTWSNKARLFPGTYEAIMRENVLIFPPGLYTLGTGLSNYEQTFHYVENIAQIVISDVPDPNLDRTIIRVNNVGVLLNPMAVTIVDSPGLSAS